MSPNKYRNWLLDVRCCHNWNIKHVALALLLGHRYYTVKRWWLKLETHLEFKIALENRLCLLKNALWKCLMKLPPVITWKVDHVLSEAEVLGKLTVRSQNVDQCCPLLAAFSKIYETWGKAFICFSASRPAPKTSFQAEMEGNRALLSEYSFLAWQSRNVRFPCWKSHRLLYPNRRK